MLMITHQHRTAREEHSACMGSLEWTGPAGRSSKLGNVVGAGPAIYEQAVVKSERVDSRGLNPTVYSASLYRHAGRRHFSFCGADLTRSSDVARSTRVDRHASRPGPRGSAAVQSRSNSTFDLFFFRHQKTAVLFTRPVSSGGERRDTPRRCAAWRPSPGSFDASSPPARSFSARSCRPSPDRRRL